MAEALTHEGLEICWNLDVDGKGYVFFQVDVLRDI